MWLIQAQLTNRKGEYSYPLSFSNYLSLSFALIISLYCFSLRTRYFWTNTIDTFDYNRCRSNPIFFNFHDCYLTAKESIVIKNNRFNETVNNPLDLSIVVQLCLVTAHCTLG